MIVTLTANPSNDRTVQLPGVLERGAVVRVPGATVEAGGKGVNVARVVDAAGVAVVAVLPAPAGDPFLELLDGAGVPHRAVPIDGRVRTNLTLAEPDGTTTKVNEPGPDLGAEAADGLVDAVVDAAAGARWAVLSGSLPPGAPDELYARIVAALDGTGCRVAVDTSGAPLAALLDGDGPAPDLVKPNAEELAEVVGGDPEHYESDPAAAAGAARPLLDRGIGTVLLTLGATGSVAVTADAALLARPPAVEPRSTVGAGDSTLAGWVLADVAGHDLATRLRHATAHGTAAVALPGTALPRPDDLALGEVTVEHLDPTGP